MKPALSHRLKRNFTRGRILAVLGTLVLGAFGSALWDVLLKPGLGWAGASLLNVTSLGIQSVTDGLYLDMAKGTYSRSAQITMLIATYALSCAFVGGVIFVRATIKSVVRKHIKPINLVQAALATPKPWHDWSLRFFFRVVYRGLMTAFVLMTSFAIGLSFIMFVRSAVVENGAVYLKQSEDIVAPFVSPEDRVQLASRIARIASKKDFLEINAYLDGIAKQNNVKLPKIDLP